MTARTQSSADPISVFDHLRVIESELSAGTYRVVGTADDRVTLLRVADADGRRVHTGEVHRVPRTDLDGFEPAGNPDENRSLSAGVAGQLDGLAWQGRLIGRAVVARPVPGVTALVLVAIGLFGDPYLPIPDLFDVLVFLAGAALLVSLKRTANRG